MKNVDIYRPGANHLYSLTTSVSNAIHFVLRVSANTLQEAVDDLADYFVNNDMNLFYESPKTDEERQELEDNGFISAGNSGFYISMPVVEELQPEPIVEGRYMCGTIEEIVSFLTNKLCSDDEFSCKDCSFNSLDFSVDTNGINFESSLEDERYNVSGWYGIKHIDTGFDSNDYDIVSDYYGGGAACIKQLYDGMSKEEVENSLKELVMNPVDSTEGSVNENDIIFVEIKEEKEC